MVFLPGIVLATLMVLLLGQKKDKVVSHYVLLSWLVLMGLHQTLFLISYQAGALHASIGIILGYCLAVAHTPLLYVYVYSVTFNRLPPRVWLHGIPYLLLALTLIFYGLSHPNAFVFQYGLLLYNGRPPFPIRQNGAFIALVALGYNGWALHRLNRHAQAVAERLSYREGVTLNWLRNWLVVALVFFVLVVGLIVSTLDFQWLDRIYTFWWVGLFITIYIFLLSYFGFRQTTLFVGIASAPTPPKKPEPLISPEPEDQARTKYKNSPLTDEVMETYSRQLVACLQSTKLYLDENLTLADLAEKTGIPAHHLSQTLNVKLGQSFFDLINHYRLEEAKTRLFDERYAHLTLLGIAYECGFKSKSAFNALFKKHTGLTPSDYKKKGIK